MLVRIQLLSLFLLVVYGGVVGALETPQSVATDVLVFARSFDNDKLEKLLRFTYNSTSREVSESENYEAELKADHEYCIVSDLYQQHRDVRELDCFTLIKIDPRYPALENKVVQLQLDKSGQIVQLALITGHGEKVSGGKLGVSVSESHSHPVPNLSPVRGGANSNQGAKKAPVVKTYTVKKTVINDVTGEEVEVEEVVEEREEEDNRSWVQKNWMYLVPGLLLVLMALPADEGESR